MYLSKISVQGFRASADHPIVCDLPGRFAVLIGANSAGKSTISESIYLAHPQNFPGMGRTPAATLGHGRRGVDIEYLFESQLADEGPLGQVLSFNRGGVQPGDRVGAWTREFSRRLGSVRTGPTIDPTGLADSIRMIYLPAARNPLDELARREARILIELMRAQQQRIDGTRNLSDLRGRATALLEDLTQHGLIRQIEQRIASHLHALTAGVAQQWPHIRAQVVDDNYLARVLELMLATLEGRAHAQPLEVTGLGYVNLLHIAVTLAAIPDPAATAAATATGAPSAPATPPAPERDSVPVGDGDDLDAARERLNEARADAEMLEDSFFPTEAFHAVVVIEEPEAHLHPQLQFALVRYLRQVVRERPEIQIVLTSHANDIISACEPDELVVLRRRGAHRVSIALAELPLTQDHKRKVRLHMDASRSAALFAERLLLVEGVTEVALIRQFAYIWAGVDAHKRSFVDSLTIVPMGTKVGEWAPALLATRGKELCTKLAVLRDSDLEPYEHPVPPSWAFKYDPDIVQFFHSHPTLEPAITTGNEILIGAVIERMLGRKMTNPPITSDQVDYMFRSTKKNAGNQPGLPPGSLVSRKAQFALELADELLQAAQTDSSDPVAFRQARGYPPPIAPAHLVDVLDFLCPPVTLPASNPRSDAASASTESARGPSGASTNGSD